MQLAEFKNEALSDFKAKAEALQTAFAATSAAPSAPTKQE